MNLGSSLNGSVAFSDCPSFDFISANRKEVDDIEQIIATVKDVIDLGFGFIIFGLFVLH